MMSLLLKSLHDKLIPWSQRLTRERFIVACGEMHQEEIPDGVILQSKPLTGKRVVTKDKRYYSNIRGISAEWPQDEMHEWDGNKMIITLSGRANFHIGNYSFQCGKGYYFMLAPNIPQQNNTRPFNEPGFYCELLFVILHASAVQCFINCAEPYIHKGQRENYLFKDNKLVLILRALMEEVLNKQSHQQVASQHLLAAFWQIMYQEMNAQRYIIPGQTTELASSKGERGDFETDLFTFIQTHLYDSLTLDDAARGMHLSRSQFVRRMREETGKTYIQFLTDYKIQEAKVLLRNTEWTNVAIASILGFRDDSYFLQVFRRVTGKTPGQYRREIHKNKI